MTLAKFFEKQPRGAKTEMASKLGISKTWMSMLITGRRIPSAELTIQIHVMTEGKVDRKELRPDLFGEL